MSGANGAATGAGAVTWINGATGLTGTVSAANSLVGTSTNELIGEGGVLALANGNYVVVSQQWTDGVNANVGAVTWANGTTGITGTISAANSLVGSHANDLVGNAGVVALPNGNYVITSTNAANGSATIAGAVTWG